MKIPQHVLTALSSTPSSGPNSYTVPVSNALGIQRYNINVTIGSPAQSFALMLDTGSADVWVPKSDSSGCAPRCPRGFDIGLSPSLVPTNITLDARYGLTPDPDHEVLGEFYNDTVSISGLPSIPNVTFGIGDVPKSLFDSHLWGIMGLGPRSQEAIGLSTTSPLPGLVNNTYTPLWERLSLASQPGIRKFSVWLNGQGAAEGTVQFGGEDVKKYAGGLLGVPLHLDPDTGLPGSWRTSLTSISRLNVTGRARSQKRKLTPENFSMAVDFDTGSPNIYLPTTLYNNIIEGLGGQQILREQFSFPCSLRAPSTGYLYFGFPTKHRNIFAEIRVPYSDVIYPFGYPCDLPRFWIGETEMCYMAIVPTDGEIKLLGAAFIRSAYLVFDLDKSEIKMAQSRWKI